MHTPTDTTLDEPQIAKHIIRLRSGHTVDILQILNPLPGAPNFSGPHLVGDTSGILSKMIDDVLGGYQQIADRTSEGCRVGWWLTSGREVILELRSQNGSSFS